MRYVSVDLLCSKTDQLSAFTNPYKSNPHPLQCAAQDSTLVLVCSRQVFIPNWAVITWEIRRPGRAPSDPPGRSPVSECSAAHSQSPSWRLWGIWPSHLNHLSCGCCGVPGSGWSPCCTVWMIQSLGWGCLAGWWWAGWRSEAETQEAGRGWSGAGAGMRPGRGS